MPVEDGDGAWARRLSIKLMNSMTVQLGYRYEIVNDRSERAPLIPERT